MFISIILFYCAVAVESAGVAAGAGAGAGSGVVTAGCSVVVVAPSAGVVVSSALFSPQLISKDEANNIAPIIESTFFIFFNLIFVSTRMAFRNSPCFFKWGLVSTLRRNISKFFVSTNLTFSFLKLFEEFAPCIRPDSSIFVGD